MKVKFNTAYTIKLNEDEARMLYCVLNNCSSAQSNVHNNFRIALLDNLPKTSVCTPTRFAPVPPMEITNG